MEQALDSRFGGLVVHHHNKVCNAIGDQHLASLVWGNVVCKHVVCDQSTSDSALVADLFVRGLGIPHSEVLFDICMMETDSLSYCDRTTLAVLSSA